MSSQFYKPFQPTLTMHGQQLFGLDVVLRAPEERLSMIIYAFVQVTVKQATVYPIVPDGTNILFFSPCRQSFGGTQQTILEVPLTVEQGEYFGIWFHPGAIRRVFDVDLADVTNGITSLNFLEPISTVGDFHHLGERLYEQTSFDARIGICERLLSQRLSSLATPMPEKLLLAFKAIYQSNGHCALGKLAELIGWSQRHLNRQFLLHTGLSIKVFAQTIRVNEYLKRCYNMTEKPLNHGLDLGFYDQSHLMKTLKQHNLNGLSQIAKEAMSTFYNPSN